MSIASGKKKKTSDKNGNKDISRGPFHLIYSDNDGVVTNGISIVENEEKLIDYIKKNVAEFIENFTEKLENPVHYAFGDEEDELSEYIVIVENVDEFIEKRKLKKEIDKDRIFGVNKSKEKVEIIKLVTSQDDLDTQIQFLTRIGHLMSNTSPDFLWRDAVTDVIEGGKLL